MDSPTESSLIEVNIAGRVRSGLAIDGTARVVIKVKIT